MRHHKKRLGIIRTIIILIAPIIIALFPTERAIACSCIVPGTPEEELEKFSAVFMGTVTSISTRNVPVEVGFYRRMIEIGVNVGRSWKGVTTDFVYLHTGAGGGDCGFPTTGLETYIFYASGPIDDLNISICSRTSLYSDAPEDRNYLEQLPALPLTHVVPQNDPSESKEEGVNILLAGTTIVLLVVVSYLIVKHQQMRKKNNP